MNVNKFNKDYNYGKSKETYLLPIIQNEFDSTLTYSPNTFAICDYVGDECNVELKSRRCSVHSYPDTMISKSKIDYLLKESKKGYCVFSFFDGVVWIEITPETVATFRNSKGGRSDRGKVESNDYCFIPTTSLKKFVNTPLGVNTDRTMSNTPVETTKNIPVFSTLSPLLKETLVSS